MSKKRKKQNSSSSSGIAAFLRKPAVQIGIVAVVALIIYLIAAAGNGGTANASTLPRDVSAAEAYELYQQSDVFFVDVRRQDEWDLYHAPNTHLITLDQLPDRLNEVPKDKKIVVICHSGNRSKEGRDILLKAGYNATSVTGGLLAWYAGGYPFEGEQPQ